MRITEDAVRAWRARIPEVLGAPRGRRRLLLPNWPFVAVAALVALSLLMGASTPASLRW